MGACYLVPLCFEGYIKLAVKPDGVTIACPRCSDVKVALIIAKLPGTSNAPPISF